MSMLSSQVDELRELATRYDELQVGAVKAVTMPSNMGSILREAADTIWQLRDDLQLANAAVRDAEHEESRAWDRVRKAEANNAKLRELSSIMLKCIMANERKKLICWECPMHKQFDELRSYCCLEHEAKKLGVEVDG